MSNRSAKFASALVASILAGANFTAVAQNTSKPAESCQSSPKGAAPAGSHWYYHVDRATKTKCWYIGEAKNKAAKSATVQQQASPAPEATEADATPVQPQAQPPQPLQQAEPVQQQPPMRKSVADARAELQTSVAPAATADANPTSGIASGNSSPTATADANPQSPAVTARWLDASSMAGTNGTRLAAAEPPAAVQTDMTPASAGAAAPAAVEQPAEKSPASTQMLLIVMVGALALAGLVSTLVFRLTRTRTPPYEIRDEWRAPWDSIHTGGANPTPPDRMRPLRLSEERPQLSAMPPRRAEPPMPRREGVRDTDEADEATRQITAMLQRLARSAAT
ncbi:hypothetical protein ACFFWD_02400 [Bradyrhizobium erythrophlei]|uniref:hypothetical protein n=1 Tax=Bradyrhizobium erythrophlei TaxID=1437360 RepID=UPI0035E5602A